MTQPALTEADRPQIGEGKILAVTAEETVKGVVPNECRAIYLGADGYRSDSRRLAYAPFPSKLAWGPVGLEKLTFATTDESATPIEDPQLGKGWAWAGGEFFRSRDSVWGLRKVVPFNEAARG